MERRPEDLCLAMEAVRRKGHQDAVTIHESLETLLDWRSYLTRHPLLTLGGAAVLGLILAPRAKKLTTADLEGVAERVAATGLGADRGVKAKGNAFTRYVLPVVAMAGPPLARAAVAGLLAELAANEQREHPVEAQHDRVGEFHEKST